MISHRFVAFGVAVLPVVAGESGWAQDSAATRIAPVRVTVTRDAARPAYELPFALTRLSDTMRAATRRSSLTELLLFIPGMSVFHRFNPSQDPRLTVRGFGARSAFGIRGVRVLRDGIPLTLADGQTAVDFLDIETIDAAEIIRGSAGALYGNSSGGVVDFRSEPPPDGALTGRVLASYAEAASRLSAYGGGRAGPVALQGTLTRNTGDGIRDYSRFRNSGGFGDARWIAGGTAFQLQGTLYDSPLAENPGALTATELDTNRTMADAAQPRRKTGKSVTHVLFAVQASRDGDRGSWRANIHHGTRSLENPLTFAIVEFDRQTFGGSLHGQWNARQTLRFAAGADLVNQSDDRGNWTNCAGLTPRPATCPGTSDRGGVTLDQRERVRGTGAYARAEVLPVDRLSLTATLRSDNTRFSVLDHRAANPVEESRTLSAVTPMFGVNWRAAPLLSIYANVSSSFETPTTTELANQPDGSTGLNRELRPQRGRTFELGTKGVWSGRVSYDAALFRVPTTDELIPFEIPNGGGRRFFRNAGRTLRRGAELGLGVQEGVLTAGVAATWLRYTYQDFVVAGTSYNGNRVPGVAATTWSAHVTARPRWGLAAIELQHAARMAADDANLSFADAYTLVNARAALDVGRRIGIEPVIGVDNVFDETYAANVVTNAAAGRFFEPGPGRTVYVAIRLAARR
jgi:iron complex outermembrane receptor protein